MQQKVLRINDYDEILPNLWLGNLRGASDKKFMENKNISIIINCTKDYPFYFEKIPRYRIPVNDNRDPNNMKIMFNHLDKAVNTIDYYLSKNEPVYVHCYAGAQRSATIVVSYLMKKYKLPKTKAIEFVKQKRPIIFFNSPTFDIILNKYESLLENN